MIFHQFHHFTIYNWYNSDHTFHHQPRSGVLDGPGGRCEVRPQHRWTALRLERPRGKALRRSRRQWLGGAFKRWGNMWKPRGDGQKWVGWKVVSFSGQHVATGSFVRFRDLEDMCFSLITHTICLRSRKINHGSWVKLGERYTLVYIFVATNGNKYCKRSPYNIFME